MAARRWPAPRPGKSSCARSWTRPFPRPDIAYLPVNDMDALPYGMVWLSAAENDMIAPATWDRCPAGTVQDAA